MAAIAGFESTMSAPAKPSMESSNDDIKGIARQRMRVEGRHVTAAEMEQKIIKALLRPMTTGQLAKAFNRKSAKSFYRDWLKPLSEDGKIEKQGDYWKRAGVAEIVVARENFDDIVKRKGFDQLECMQDFVKHCKTLNNGKGDLKWVSQFWKACTGKIVPDFKQRPEHWTKDTTLQFVDALQEHTGQDRLTAGKRQLLRYVHEYVLKQPMTDNEKELWHLDGEKDNPGIYNMVKLHDGQFDKLIEFYLNRGELEAAGYCSYGIQVFGRPEALFMARTGTMRLVHRTREYVAVASSQKKNFDPTAVEQFRIIAAMHPQLAAIKAKDDDIYEGTLVEFKTSHAPWPKKIIDDLAVKTFSEYEATRKGKEKYFGNDGERYWQFNYRMARTLREGYHELGLIPSVTVEPPKKTPEWFMWRKPSYSFRHFGAHIWLDYLGGSYEALAEMGWEDPGIPKKFYAGYNAHLLDERIRRIE